MSTPDDLDEDDLLAKFIMIYKQTHQMASVAVLREEAKKQPSSQLDCPTVPRIRKSVSQIYRELGDTYFHRAFRMKMKTFEELFKILKPGLTLAVGSKYKNHEPNGRITLTVRLGCALHFLLAEIHMISHVCLESHIRLCF